VRLIKRPRFEVGQILRDHGPTYRLSHAVTDAQRQALAAMIQCRTAALGGHLDQCNACDYSVPSYNSCRHRACPKCQGQRQQEWIAKQADRCLPVPYSHVVFTLPAELRDLARENHRVVYGILFAAASRTVLRFGKDPRHLGGLVGVTAVLHTWTSTLHYHPHVHLIVTAGGLSGDGERWVPNRWGSRYLFPARALARAFRSAFVRALLDARARGKLVYRGACARLSSGDAFTVLKQQLYAKDWVVYAKQPFKGVVQLYRYLGRYTHRVGLSNDRILDASERTVTIRSRRGPTTFGTLEFMRRFLQHVPPKGFVRVRHYGLFACSNLRTKLKRARELLETEEGARESPSGTEEREPEIRTCPACFFGELQRHELLPCPKPLAHPRTPP